MLEKLCGWLEKSMKKKGVIMASTCILIFHFVNKITQTRSLYFGNHVDGKGTKPQRNIFRTSGVGFTYATYVSEGQASQMFYNCGSSSYSHFSVES